MEKKDLPKKIPDISGVYFFKKKKKEKKPLYIGKATSLSTRVQSYFAKDLEEKRGPWIAKMISESETVEFVETDSVLEAFLLENELIKKFKPKYNSKEKDDKSPNYVVITREEFPVVSLLRGKELSYKDAGFFRKAFGPFPYGGDLREALKIIRKLFPWRDKKCFPSQGEPCFNRQIGLCPGVCTGEITKKEYAFLIKNLEKFLAGKKKDVIKNYEREMKRLASAHEFEKAKILRDKIFALNHIQDIALLKKEKQEKSGLRIEGYDIAHISGEDTVGVMVVVQDGYPAKNEYRKFKISAKRKVNDTAHLKEVLTRRFRHSEWPFPQIIVIDGGQAQFNTAEKVLRKFSLPIKIISVVKNEKHKPSHFGGDAHLVRLHKDEIVLANAEAHRFAIGFHKERRGKRFLRGR